MTELKSENLNKLLSDPKVKSWRAIMHSFKSILTDLEKGLSKNNCSLSRFQILFLLYFEPKQAAVELAKNMYVTRGNMSQFIKRMEKDKLIQSLIEPDSKRPVYCLTDKGKLLFEALLPGHIQRVKAKAPQLSSKTIKDLLAT